MELQAQKYPSSLNSTKMRKKTMDGMYRDIDKTRQDLTMNTPPFFQACFKIILYNSSLGDIGISCGLDLGIGTGLGIEPITYLHSLRPLRKIVTLQKPCMIASRSIQDNGDRTYNITFVLLSHIKENDKKGRFRDLK